MRQLLRMFAPVAFGLAWIASTAPATSQENVTAVIFESFMDSYFGDEDGYVSLDTLDLVFAPEGQIDAAVGIVDANGDVLAQYGVYPDYKLRDGVFGRVQVVGPADLQLTEPGIYTLVFVAGGQAISRFPFQVNQSGDGSDPYDPQKTYVFDGYWRTLAHITVDNAGTEPRPVFSIWLIPVDMATPDVFQESFDADLTRDGTLIAHAKRQSSTFGKGDFGRQQVVLFQPHDQKGEANAVPLTMAELSVDGDYELKVTRVSDSAVLRDFKFTVANGEIAPLARTQLGFEPVTDFIAPRVVRKGSTVYEFEEAIWIAGE